MSNLDFGVLGDEVDFIGEEGDFVGEIRSSLTDFGEDGLDVSIFKFGLLVISDRERFTFNKCLGSSTKFSLGFGDFGGSKDKLSNNKLL